MATTVGTENTAEKLIENCILLEHDAIAAYDTVIERLDSAEYKAQVSAFRDDHHAHLDALRTLAEAHGVTPPTEGDMKQMLTTGKVKLADMMGDDASILRAMSTNESDTVSAYQHASENASLPAEMAGMVETALADEKRHKAWMESHSTAD
ncbi:ferritin-like domain-containing protein [Pseudoroseicyclus tamaricis]|uniref:Ferritin-like domain-containing protein n=1 Tax=Pseudoroseicyclus tamaricis TaxID=2705421 RepID=A0A6B2JWE9_9RHOB|nr:ferritin-like domain-containing protein [Pseudoroseicyclus tamaricis]NDV02235.1 ferritin-like domain-containing protein [Pseudoroseicyclus tamaricis]